MPAERCLVGGMELTHDCSLLVFLRCVLFGCLCWPGVDAGGVTKEFFQLLIEELFAKETGTCNTLLPIETMDVFLLR